MRKLIIPLAVVVIVVVVAVVGWRVYSGPPAPPARVGLGGVVEDFTLTDLNGQTHSLSSLQGEKGTLLIFIATKCPYSNAYNQRMEALHRDYSARGVRVVGINPNKTEPADEVRSHAQQNGLTFIVLKDPDNRIADYFGASVTPETYLLDAGNVLRYHGRLDADHHDAGLNAGEQRQALEELLGGRTIANTGKKAFGCTIKRVG